MAGGAAGARGHDTPALVGNSGFPCRILPLDHGVMCICASRMKESNGDVCDYFNSMKANGPFYGMGISGHSYGRV